MMEQDEEAVPLFVPVLECGICDVVIEDLVSGISYKCWGCRRRYHWQCCDNPKVYTKENDLAEVYYCTDGLCANFEPLDTPLSESFLNYPVIQESLRTMLTDEAYISGPLLNFINGLPMIFLMVHVESDTIVPVDKVTTTESDAETVKEHAKYREKIVNLMKKFVDIARINFMGDRLARTKNLRNKVKCTVTLPQGPLNLAESLKHLIVTKTDPTSGEKVYLYHKDQLAATKTAIGLKSFSEYSKNYPGRTNHHKHQYEFAKTPEMLAMLKRPTHETIVQTVATEAAEQIISETVGRGVQIAVGRPGEEGVGWIVCQAMQVAVQSIVQNIRDEVDARLAVGVDGQSIGKSIGQAVKRIVDEQAEVETDSDKDGEVGRIIDEAIQEAVDGRAQGGIDAEIDKYSIEQTLVEAIRNVIDGQAGPEAIGLIIGQAISDAADQVIEGSVDDKTGDETAFAKSVKSCKMTSLDMIKLCVAGVTMDDAVFKEMLTTFHTLFNGVDTEVHKLPGFGRKLFPWVMQSFFDYIQLFEKYPALNVEHLSMSFWYGATNAMGGLPFFHLYEEVQCSRTKLEFNPRSFTLIGLLRFLPQAMQDRYLVGELAYLLGFEAKFRSH